MIKTLAAMALALPAIPAFGADLPCGQTLPLGQPKGHASTTLATSYLLALDGYKASEEDLDWAMRMFTVELDYCAANPQVTAAQASEYAFEVEPIPSDIEEYARRR